MNIKRSIKFFFQRLWRGWDDSETWALDYTIAKFVLPRLIRFKLLNNGFPYGFTSESWDQELDKMIYAMEAYVNRDNLDKCDSYDWDKVHAGQESFGKYFGHLWW